MIGPDTPDWFETGMAAVWPPYARFDADALPVASASGVRLTLADGRELIDGIANWWSACHGHGHPHIKAAIEAQLQRFPHVMFAGLAHESAYRLAERLTRLVPGDFSRVFFTESGSVSVEVGMKIALQHAMITGRRYATRFLSFRGGYHGDTLATMPLCDPEEGMHAMYDGVFNPALLADLPEDAISAAALDRLLADSAREIAAVVVEPLVQGAGGMKMHSPEVLRTIRTLCDRHGVLLIFDEIFTGFGRTGTMFAFEQAGAVPDILCLSKALSGGTLPLAATLARRPIAEAFEADHPAAVLMHGPTYMANALACAAACASLDLFETEPRLEQAAQIEAQLAAELEPCRAMPGVVDVRVKGAIGVVQMDRQTEGLRHRFPPLGVWARPFRDIVYLTPPLIAGEADLARLTAAVRQVVREATPMNRAWTEFLSGLSEALDEAEGQNRRRTLRPMTRLAGGRVHLEDGRTLIDVSSNDYLGLALHPLVRTRAADYAQRLGGSAAASRLVTGTLPEHLAVEQRLAAFKRADAALLFASGYQANASVLPALIELMAGPVKVFADRLNHASLHAGLNQAGVRQIRFRHNDLDHLERQLQAADNQGRTRLIVTESVFSMDGDRADLEGLMGLADRHDAILYIDEAHATGVLGPHGAGLCATLPKGAPVIVMGTLGKALGGFGAYVAGPRTLIDALIQRCGGFIYSTAPPPAVLGALDAALDLIPGMDLDRERLLKGAARVRAAAQAREFATFGSTTQITPIGLGAESRALNAAKIFEEAGLLAVAIRPPTVAEGASRLRLTLSAAHEDAVVDRLVEAIGAIV